MQRRYNGTRVNLEQALALLIQSQAASLAGQRETDRRFLRIERDLDQIKAILLRHEQILTDLVRKVDRHEQILNDLPEAVRRKIGFKAK